MNTRSEHDLLGDAEVPADAYWGIHTLRAVENYPITGKAIGSYAELVRALANAELGELDAMRAEAIVDLCLSEVIALIREINLAACCNVCTNPAGYRQLYNIHTA